MPIGFLMIRGLLKIGYIRGGNMKIYYVYQHILADTNEVFYVGISSKTPISKKHERAQSKQGRSTYWHDITKDREYNVQIVLETHKYSDVVKKEKQLIRLYGRRDLSTGTLVNRSKGGEHNFKSKLGYANRRKDKRTTESYS